MTKDFEFVKSTVDGTDWNLLQQQKLMLLTMTWGENSKIHHNLSVEQAEAIDGIVHFLDFIQDSVVDLGYRTKEEIFALEEIT